MANSNYTIQNGDTLSGIAARNNTSVSALLAANPNITNPNLIIAGRNLSLPGAPAPASPAAPVVPTTPPAGTAGGTGAPTSPIAAPGAPRRYTGTGTPSNYDAQAAEYFNGLDTTAPDRQKIYNEQLSQMQAQIDAINNVYTGLIREENVRGVDRSGKTRAVNARSGILGDDFGMANKAETDAFNAAKIEDLNRRKAADIQAILSKVQSRTDEAFNRAQELSFANKEKKLAYAKELQTEARQNLSDLAKTGVSLDQLTQDEYNALIDQTGLDELEMESIFNAAKTAREKIDYNYINIGNGRVLRTGKDGNGKATEEKIFDYGLPPEYDIKETKDGQLYSFDKRTGKMTPLGGGSGSGNGAGGGVEDPTVQAWVQNIKNGVAKLSDVPNELSNAVSLGLSKAQNSPSALKSEAIDSGKEILRQIEEEARKSGFTSAVGNKGFLSGNLFGLFGKKDEQGGGAGTKRANFNQQFNNFSSLLQLDAAKYLKGQGAISESERQILANASANLSLGLKPDQFKKNLVQILTTLQNLDAKNAGVSQAGGSLQDQVRNAGYDYDAMKADGLTDEQIRASLNP